MIGKRNAFTLIELIIVITILGVGILILLPVISSNVSDSNKIEVFFTEKIKESCKIAKETGTPVYISGVKGSSNLTLATGKTVKLPDNSNVLNIKINDKQVTGLKYSIGIYPQGICDYFELTTDKGKTIVSIPLLLEARQVL